MLVNTNEFIDKQNKEQKTNKINVRKVTTKLEKESNKEALLQLIAHQDYELNENNIKKSLQKMKNLPFLI
jgi:hypothetical protein